MAEPVTKSRNQQVVDRQIRKKRWQIVSQLNQIMEAPMIVMALIWIALTVMNLVSPHVAYQGIISVIWYLFILDFFVRLGVAPSKKDFLKHNWLGAIGMVLPALRVFQIFGFVSALQSVTALSGGSTVLMLLSGVNRGMNALRKMMKRRNAGYVIALTALVIFCGAGGMLALERGVHASNGIHNYPQALYWTTMLVTTIGSDYWPQTVQGKVLCLFLSMYSIGVLGYVAGTLASFFIGKDANDDNGEIAGEKRLRLLQAEVCKLRQDVQYLISIQTGTPLEAPECNLEDPEQPSGPSPST